MKQKIIIFLFLMFTIVVELMAQNSNGIGDKLTGFFDQNAYYDTRGFEVLTTNVLIKANRIKYFSLNNIYFDLDGSESGSFYSEQNLRYKPFRKLPFDFSLQYVIRDNKKNDDIRLGIIWHIHQTGRLGELFKKINLSYSPNFHLVQKEINNRFTIFPQLEHVYTLKLFKDRIYISGFADQNIVCSDDRKIGFKWVTENQLGIKVLNNFFFVFEHRYNQYLDNSLGFGIGIEYKYHF